MTMVQYNEETEGTCQGRTVTAFGVLLVMFCFLSSTCTASPFL